MSIKKSLSSFPFKIREQGKLKHLKDLPSYVPNSRNCKKMKPEKKKSGWNVISIHDFCDTRAVLYQLS